MSDWGMIILFLSTGFIFLLIELFIIPGFGFMGLLGLGMMAWAIFKAWQIGTTCGVTSLVVSLIAITAVLIIISKTKLCEKMRLKNKETHHNGFNAHNQDLKELLNKEGQALSHLRPAGTAIIDNQRVDVVTDGIYLDPETKIKVAEVKGGRVVVKEV